MNSWCRGLSGKLMFRQHRTKRHLLYAFCLLVILLIELLEKR